VFSLRRYLLVNVALFLLFSALCGQASSLSEMIVLRALQSFAGGVMIPLAFTIVMTMLPRSKHAIGLAGFVAPQEAGGASGLSSSSYRGQ
jgi:MFS transporter, DHA2 family, multidrug resistance protein